MPSSARLTGTSILALLLVACGAQVDNTSTGTGTGGNGGGTPNGCRTSKDCEAQGLPNGECEHPEFGCTMSSCPFVGCGDDADCSANQRCFVCWNGCGVCVDACTGDADCRTGTTCDATGHCVRKPCSSDAECSPNFTCSQGSCARRSCTKDADCGDYCYQEFCVETLGVCEI
jgi:hypothetical protein